MTNRIIKIRVRDIENKPLMKFNLPENAEEELTKTMKNLLRKFK